MDAVLCLFPLAAQRWASGDDGRRLGGGGGRRGGVSSYHPSCGQ